MRRELPAPGSRHPSELDVLPGAAPAAAVACWDLPVPCWGQDGGRRPCGQARARLPQRGMTSVSSELPAVVLVLLNQSIRNT